MGLLLISILAVFTPAAGLGLPTATQLVSQDKVWSNGLETKVSLFQGPRDCSNLTGLFGHLYNVSGLPAQPADRPMVETICRPDDHGLNQSGVRLTWKLKQFSGVENTRGFEITLDGPYRDHRCMVISLPDNITTELVKESKPSFVAEFYPLPGNENVFLSLFSLPRSQQFTPNPVPIVKTSKCKRPMSSSEWCPANFTSVYDAGNKTLKISFSPPPEHFKLSQYEIGELILDTASSLINTTRHIYYAVEAGNYSFNINPYESDPTNCVCRNNEGNCYMCMGCHGYVVRVPEGSSPSEQKTSPVVREEPTSVKVTLLPVLAAIIVLGLVLVVGYIVLHRYCGISIDWSFLKSENDKKTRGLVILVESTANSRATLRLKEIFTAKYGKTFEYHILTLGQQTTERLQDLLKQSGWGNAAKEPRSEFQVITCLASEKNDNWRVYKTFADNVRTFKTTLEASTAIQVHGFIVGTDDDTVPVWEDGSIHCFNLETDQDKLLSVVSSCLETSPCRVYLPNKTAASSNRSSQYNGLTVAMETKNGRKCRYPSNNDSCVGSSVSTTYNHDSLTRFSEIDDEVEADQERQLYGANCTQRQCMLGHDQLQEHGGIYPPCMYNDKNYDGAHYDAIHDQNNQYNDAADIADTIYRQEDFLPPTPSVMSVFTDDRTDPIPDNRQISDRAECNENAGSAQVGHAHTADDIGTVMEQCMSLNERNGFLKVGEVYSVCEGYA